MADALLNVWLTTREGTVAEALRLLYQERKAHFGTIPVVAFAAGVANHRPEWSQAMKLPKFSPTALTGYSGLYQQNGESLPAYDDGLAWQYGAALAKASESGQMDPEFIAYAAARTYGDMLTMELFYHDRPWPVGLHFFDIQQQPRFVPKTGRLDVYAATAKKLMGGRGIQLAWIAAGILPDLRRHPEVWERYYQQHHRGEPLVRVVDDLPVLDGRRDQAYEDSAVLPGRDSSVALLSGTKDLFLFIESSARNLELSIRDAGPVSGTPVSGHILASADGSVTATNDLGEPLSVKLAFQRGPKWTAELCLPYTVVPGQKQWINGVENGRYVVSCNGSAPRTVYMLSHPQRIIRRLEAYVDGTIKTWQGIWNELGIIPSGYRGTNLKNAHWEISDAGNYAHLIRLIALHLLDRQGLSEWQAVKTRRSWRGSRDFGIR